MKSRFFFVISAFLFSGCAISQSTPTTSTVVTTTTIDLGSDCNTDAYSSWYLQVNDLTEKASNLQSGTKLLNNNNNYKYVNYFVEVRDLIRSLDVPKLNYQYVLQTIDDHIEDVHYYIAYNGNSYSVAQINTSRVTMYREINIFKDDYWTLCNEN